MPPKPKFTKEEIISAALEIIEQEGTDSLTARSLGMKLGGSSRPLFTVFASMDEIWTQVKLAARRQYDERINEALKGELGFLGTGMEYIKFAIQKPNLFRLLFSESRSDSRSMNNVLPELDHNYEDILGYVENKCYSDKSAANIIYMHMWIYSHGIASMCAEGVCKFSEEEIKKMLMQVYKGVVYAVKGEEL